MAAMTAALARTKYGVALMAMPTTLVECLPAAEGIVAMTMVIGNSGRIVAAGTPLQLVVHIIDTGFDGIWTCSRIGGVPR